MSTVLQLPRALSIATPLSGVEFLVTEFTGQESLSSLFAYQVTMFSDNLGVTPRDLVGKKVTVKLTADYHDDRYFHGYVSSLTAESAPVSGPGGEEYREYRADIVPWMWFLTRTSDCRIFQNKKAPDIIKDVFDKYNFSDVDLKVTPGDYPEWEYCVQYRETAFNFVSRLMEQTGMFYFFRQEQDKHVLVIGDKAGHYAEVSETPIVCNVGELSGDQIESWTHRYEFRSGKFAQADYNFEKSGDTNLLTEERKSARITVQEVENYELFDYPGEYADKDAGKKLARVRIEEEEAPYDVVDGTGAYRSFTPGAKFKLTEHAYDGEKADYVITSVSHFAIDTTHFVAATDQQESYDNSFTCIPAEVVFRPPRLTPKPTIAGLQTAVVTGPSGEEIHTDKYGRVKVQFHWDREGQNDENSSCWIRVAQSWAGKQWGALFHPRIGHEVVVEFLEGDPDRPLITGSVYNDQVMPPYDPDGEEKTKSTIKSRSTKQGGDDNFNEIRFEDKTGEEEFFVQAEKNMEIKIKNNRVTKIGFETADPGDEALEINNDQTENVGNDRTVDIGNNDTLNVGSELLIDAGSKITIQTGASSITMTSGGDITIEGITITINGTEISAEAQATATLKSNAKTEVNSSGITEVKGSLVKIN